MIILNIRSCNWWTDCVESNLSRKFADLGAKKVIILDSLSSAYSWNIAERNNIEFIQGDIVDDAVLKRVFKQKPDYVYHLVTHFANQNSVNNPEKDLMARYRNVESFTICTFN